LLIVRSRSYRPDQYHDIDCSQFGSVLAEAVSNDALDPVSIHCSRQLPAGHCHAKPGRVDTIRYGEHRKVTISAPLGFGENPLVLLAVG